MGILSTKLVIGVVSNEKMTMWRIASYILLLDTGL